MGCWISLWRSGGLNAHNALLQNIDVAGEYVLFVFFASCHALPNTVAIVFRLVPLVSAPYVLRIT